MPKTRKSFSHVSLMVPEGGHLVTGTNSADSAGALNYVEKLNFRRESDGEVRREGWDRFSAVDPEGALTATSNSLFEPEAYGRGDIRRVIHFAVRLWLEQ